ncbi:PKD domain-containing protein [Neolewinella aurantiaca]|uniref:PKD domain-containing protein n=1 Tax=Neolewinella aurantiaca TaxID=2602767 RepID=A0A5C7FRN1_9BACT|nr:PKD domain-containing protein [Neolewinella aurantiaca]TXF88147.1 PKD domain-containing protein [Neolewinella aurantiaca]
MKLFQNIHFSHLAGAWLIILFSLFTGISLHAAGIKDIAPTEADSPVMLETGRIGFNNFADFDGAPEGRLVVSFGRADEVLYLGLAPGYDNNGNPYTNVTRSRYRFQIKKVNVDGPDDIVHGPFTVTNLNANVNSYAEAEYGVYSVDQLVSGDSMYVFRPGETGDYYIEFDDATVSSRRVNIPFWDFTVVRDGDVREGRVWSRGWAFRTPQVTGTNPPDCVWDREFNGTLFSYTEDGFVSKIDFQDSGFQGLSFNIAFNETGPGTSGNLAEDRKSVAGLNETAMARQHRIFLSLPDIEIFPDGICGEVNAGESFICGGVDPYCLEVEVTRQGQVEIILDFDGNGLLDDNGMDVALVYDFPADSLTACIPWNGLLADSTPVSFTDTVDVIINYAQGVQHYSAYDVEFLKNGFCVETVRPTCNQGQLTSNRLFYDDRDIPEDPGTGVSKDGRDGCDCGDGCRTWNNFALNPGGTCDTFDDDETVGYGDKSTLNTYWFASSQSEFRARVPVISANIVGPTDICEGETSLLRAVDAGVVGSPAFLWEGPGVDGITTDTVRISEAGTYCVLVTDPTGCVNRTCTDVTVADFDASPFPSALSICFGESVQLPVAGNSSYDYLWSPATGIDDVNSNQPTFNPGVTTTYSVVITNNSATGSVCTTTEEVTITVSPDIDLQVIGGGPICDPTTTITATTAVAADVVLFNPLGVQVGAGNTFTLDVSGESEYLIVATDPQGCTDSITFTVSGGPVDIAVPDTVLSCLSDGVNLAVTNLDENDALTYLWAPAELFDPATVSTANPTFVGDPGDYAATVTVTNQYGCMETEDVQIIVIDDSGALSFSSMVDCDGSTVTFTNSSTVSFGYVYDFGDGTTSTDANPVHVYDSPGTYTVTLDLVYDQNCVTSFTQEVTTFPLVLDAGFSIGLDDCDNGTATLTFTDESINATGSGLDYEWTFTGVVPTTSTDQNPSVVISESGTVTATLEVTSEDDCTSTLDTTFTVNLAVIDLEEEIVICPGDSTELNPGADEGLTYNWSPATDFDANDSNPTTSIAGTYVVSVTATSADFNCANTDTVTVVIADSIGLVVNGPDGPLTGDDGGNGNGGNGGNNGEVILPTVQTCGNPIDLDVNLTTNDDVNIVYTDLDGNVLGSGSEFTVNPSGRDTIVITATNEFGCIERDTVVIINNQVDAGINVGASGVNLCAAMDTMVAVVNNDPNDTLTYSWEPNDIINGPLDGEFVDITAPAEGTVDLMVTVTNQFGCDTVITVPVTVTPFTPNMYVDVIQPCFNEGFVIDGGPQVDGYNYEWVPSDDLDLTDPANPVGTFDEDGTLTVTITDPLTGCSETQTINVDVAPEISFMASPVDTVICEPADITVGGTSVNDDVVIVWYDDEDLNNEIGTGPTYTVEAAEVGQTYTVYGEATDPNTGCSQVVPVTVTVSDITAGLPLENVDACAGDQPSIFAPGGVNGVLDYTYEPSDLIDDSDPTNPVFVGTSSSTITVTTVDPATGCSSTNDVVINVTDLGGLFGTAEPDTIFIGETSDLSVEGECVGCTYEWMGGNGTIVPNTGQTVTVTPDEAGDVTYEVVVTQNGCTEIVTITLRVEDPLCDFDHVYIPNAFTPNQDGRNEVMRVRSNFADQITDFRWIIYNRWGQEVYTSDDINDSWDGTIEGDDLEPDVYGYWLRLTCPTGEPFVKQGNITILR